VAPVGSERFDLDQRGYGGPGDAEPTPVPMLVALMRLRPLSSDPGFGLTVLVKDGENARPILEDDEEGSMDLVGNGGLRQIDLRRRGELDDHPLQTVRSCFWSSARTSDQGRAAVVLERASSRRSLMIASCQRCTGTSSGFSAMRSHNACTKAIFSSTESSEKPGGGVIVPDIAEMLRDLCGLCTALAGTTRARTPV